MLPPRRIALYYRSRVPEAIGIAAAAAVAMIIYLSNQMDRQRSEQTDWWTRERARCLADHDNSRSLDPQGLVLAKRIKNESRIPA